MKNTMRVLALVCLAGTGSAVLAKDLAGSGFTTTPEKPKANEVVLRGMLLKPQGVGGVADLKVYLDYKVNNVATPTMNLYAATPAVKDQMEELLKKFEIVQVRGLLGGANKRQMLVSSIEKFNWNAYIKEKGGVNVIPDVPR